MSTLTDAWDQLADAELTHDQARAQLALAQIGIDTKQERIYEVADIIEQKVLETRPIGHWWTISAVARKGHLDPAEAGRVLAWMAEHSYIITNGRGGCWVNYGRKH